MVVERREEIARRIPVAEIFPPARLAAIGMGKRLAKQLEIPAIDDAARWPRHMRFAVHRREGGDIAKCADRPAGDLGAVRLTAVFDGPNAARMRFGDDLVGRGGLAGGMHEKYRGDTRAKPFAHLGNPDIVAVRFAVTQPRLEAVEDDRADPSRIGDRRKPALRKSSAASAINREDVPVATASA